MTKTITTTTTIFNCTLQIKSIIFFNSKKNFKFINNYINNDNNIYNIKHA